MRSCFIFCIFEDIVTVAGSVLINTVLLPQYFFRCLLVNKKKYKSLVNHYNLLNILIILACTLCG